MFNISLGLRAKRYTQVTHLAARTALVLSVALTACGDDDEIVTPSGGNGGSKAGSGGSGGAGGAKAGSGGAGGSSGSSASALYGLQTSISSSDNTSLSYFALLDNLDPQEVDLDTAREFSGSADAWVWENELFIADGETNSIVKYTVDGKNLVKGDAVSFMNEGVTYIGFWLNVFISPTKAYLVNSQTNEYVVWNPKTMEITGKVPMPELTVPTGMKSFPSYTDRSAAIRDGKLYHPFYYTDDTYFKYTQNSSIAVYDVESDALLEVIEAPCPGLDHVTQDDDGNLFFSAWIYAPGAAAVLDQPATCVAKIAKDENKATVAFTVKDITGGREGGVFRYTGDGKGILSVLHPDHETDGIDTGDASMVTFGARWHFYSYEFASNEATEIETIPWNAGAAYAGAADGKSYSLVPGDGYAKTNVWDVTTPSDPKELFEIPGWSMRVVKVR